MTDTTKSEVGNPYKFPFPEGPDRFPFPDGPMASPPPEFARRRRECPVGKVYLPMGDEVLLAVKHADIHFIMSEDELFTRDLSQPGTPQLFPNMDILQDPTILMNMHGKDHLRLRRIIGPALNPRWVEEWRPEIREIIASVLDEMAEHGSPADLMQEYARKVPIRLVLRQFELPDSDAERLQRWISTWLSVAVPEQMAAVKEEFSAWVVETAARSRANPGTSLFDRLVNAHDEGDRMSDTELESMVRSIIPAAIETIGNGISRSAFTLLRERHLWESLVADRSQLAAAVEELIRVNPPGGGSVGLLRMAAQDVQLPTGTLVKKGQWLVTPAVSAGHDEEVFPDPTQFKIDRPKSPSNMQFGAGRHFCPGAHLGKAEIEESLAGLMERFPSLRMTVPPEDLDWDNTTFNVGLPELPVAW
jgi:cytochrome P450